MIVVSGLPRSGTSLMMEMLQAGGLRLVTDSRRAADVDNPDGYFEDERVKLLASGESGWLADHSGQAVKIISALPEYLPPRHQYKLLVMEREIDEILQSQNKMLRRRGETSTLSDTAMKEEFIQHLSALKFWLPRQPHVQRLYINYNKMVIDSDSFCRAIADFIELPLDLEKMRSVPDQKLYRNRSTPEKHG